MTELNYFVYTNGEIRPNRKGYDEWDVKFASTDFPSRDGVFFHDETQMLTQLELAYRGEWKRFGDDLHTLKKAGHRPANGRPGFALLPWNDKFCLAIIFYPWIDHGKRPSTGLVVAAVSRELCERVTPSRFFAALSAQNDLKGISRPRLDGFTAPRPAVLNFDESNLSGDAFEELQGLEWPDVWTAKIVANGRSETLPTSKPPTSSEIDDDQGDDDQVIDIQKRWKKTLIFAVGAVVAIALLAALLSGGSPPRHPPVPIVTPIVKPAVPSDTSNLKPVTPRDLPLAKPNVPPVTSNIKPAVSPDTLNIKPVTPPDTPVVKPAILPVSPNITPVAPDMKHPEPPEPRDVALDTLLSEAQEAGLGRNFAVYEAQCDTFGLTVELKRILYGFVPNLTVPARLECRPWDETDRYVFISPDELKRGLERALEGKVHRPSIWQTNDPRARAELKARLLSAPDNARASEKELAAAQAALRDSRPSTLTFVWPQGDGLRLLICDEHGMKALFVPLPETIAVLRLNFEQWYDRHVLNGNDQTRPSIYKWYDTDDKVVLVPQGGRGVASGSIDSLRLAAELVEDFERKFKKNH